MERGFRWLVTLVALISFALAIVSILVIRSTWHDDDNREVGIIWLYVTTFTCLVVATMSAISAELTVDLCKLPYSGKLAMYSN